MSDAQRAAKAWDPFEALTEAQRGQLAAFEEQLLAFNRRINLISSETEADFEERHLLHSLALSWKAFPAGTTVVDWGTGGGLPAVPLAIRFPEVAFHAVDAVGKKVQAVRVMGRRLGLPNLEAWQGRAEQWPGRAHYAVSRATAPLLDLWTWYDRVRAPLPIPVEEGIWPQGLICLKGGDLSEEIAALKAAFPSVRVEHIDLHNILGRPYFAAKHLLTVSDL